MRNFLKKAFLLGICAALVFSLVSCDGKEKEYDYTTEKAADFIIPTNSYGTDLYTADLPSLKKMSGMIYKGGDFGEIKDAEAASKAMVKVITDIYGKKALDGFEPLIVSENKRAGCWIIHGTPKDNLNTGVSFVAVRKDTGEIVMVLKNPDEKR